ncbi:type II secretion system protein [Chloroflexota bacterium]
MRLKLPHNGERGFTLIEILVVVAILGTIAGIVIPNVLHLKDEGRIDAANTESHNVQLLILSAMVDHEIIHLATGGALGPNAAGDKNIATIAELLPPAVEEEDSITTYITGILQAIYTVNDEGHIESAFPVDTAVGNSKWKGLSYTQDLGWTD